MDKKSLRRRTENNYKNKDGEVRKGLLDLSGLKDVKYFSPKVGTNNIAIVPFVRKTNISNEVKKGDLDYILDVWVHKNVGPGEETTLCLKRSFKKACPICEEQASLRDSGDNEDLVKALSPSRRAIYNVIDLKDDTEEVKIYDASHFLVEKELLEEANASDDGEIICYSDPDEKISIIFRGSEESFGSGKYVKPKSFKFRTHKELIVTDEHIEKSYSLDALLKVPSYEEIKSIFTGEAAFSSKKEVDDLYEDEEEDKDEGPIQANGKPAKTNKAPKEKCPSGYEFGVDTDEYDACDQCDLWEKCVEAKGD